MLKVRIKNKDELSGKLKRIVSKQLQEGGLLIVAAEKLEDALKRYCPVATGKLRNQIQVKSDGNNLLVTIPDIGKVKGLTNSSTIHRSVSEHYRVNPNTRRKSPKCSSSNGNYISNSMASSDFVDKAFKEILGISVDIDEVKSGMLPFKIINKDKLKNIILGKIYVN